MTSALLAKEIRALLPMWAALFATLAGGYLQHTGVLVELSVAAFIVGPGLLGAHAIGHEYSHRTLQGLLVQPVDRRRVFLIKWIVSTMMALTVCAASAVVLAPYATGMWQPWSVRVLPLLAGALMAPWLAMRLRGTLPAVVAGGTWFSMSLIVPVLAQSIVTGVAADVVHARLVVPWSIVMIACCLTAGIAGVRGFITLEAGGDAARSLTLPRFGSSSPRRFRPIAALAAKELQMQQLPIVLGAFFIAGSIVLLVLQRLVAWFRPIPIGGLLTIYCVCLSLVIGAMASAEERHLGVAEWQLLQPAAARMQWGVKMLIAIGLSVLFAAVVPAALVLAAPNRGDSVSVGALLLVAVFLTSAGLYLSSLTRSGTAAMVASLPAGLALSTLLSFLDHGPLAVTGRALSPVPFMRTMAIVAIPLLLWLAYLNHRSGERRQVTIAWQAATIAVVVAVTRLLVVRI